MIHNAEDLDQTLQQIARLYRALATLREQVLPKSPARFGLMAEGPLAEIRRLEAAAHEYCGRTVAERADAELWMRIAGPTIEWPEAPTSVLTSFLDTLRKGVQTAAEFLHTGSLSTRPSKAIKKACDLQVLALQPGSGRGRSRLRILRLMIVDDAPPASESVPKT